MSIKRKNSLFDTNAKSRFALDLSVITVTYQSQEYIAECILSVISHSFSISYEHLIVDNGSTDGTLNCIENSFSDSVVLIKNPCNLGFSHANNQAVLRAKGKFILFLNPDMQICHGSLDALIEWMAARPDVGLASCRLVTGAKEPHPVLRPSRFPSLSPYLASFLRLRPFFLTVHPKFSYPAFDDEKEQEVEVIRGAFMLVPRALIERLGHAFSPDYFLLFEDLDLCREVKQLDLKTVYTPLMSCIDYFGASFAHKTAAWKYLCGTKSLKTYVRKWHSPWHLIWLNLAISIGFLLRIPEWGLQASWHALLALKSKEPSALR